MIALGCDHGGFDLMQKVKEHLVTKGVAFKDFGTYTNESCDYPEYAKKVCAAINDGTCSKGILICGTGIGMSMVANKVAGIRAALCNDVYSAKLTREHNDANVLCMGSRVTGDALALMITDEFLDTEFSNEARHQRRINMMGEASEPEKADEMIMVMDHPLIQHKIGIIRREDTSSKEFREMIGEIAMLMCYEAARNLPLEDVQITTPICDTTAKKLQGKKTAIIPILRAGLGMVEGMLSIIPAAKVGHIGLYRDPATLEPVEYYCKLPSDIESREVFVTDPMLATGGSAAAAITLLKQHGARKIHFMCIIGAPEGVRRMREEHPDVDLYIGALDERLNDHGYIVPGLGDAGDRIFGTK